MYRRAVVSAVAASFAAARPPLAVAQQPQLCAVPVAAAGVPGAPPPVQAAPSAAAPEVRLPRPAAPATGMAVTPPPDPSALGLPPLAEDKVRASSALRHIRAAGAALYDIGFLHGMQSVFAVARDPATGRGVFQVFYVTPDGEVAIGGVAQDGGGANLTLERVRDIPGVLPSVHILPAAGAAVAPQAAMSPEIALRAAEGANYGLWGPEGAPRLYVFVDPRCGFSIRAMAGLKPFVDTGKLQVAIIPVSILDYEDDGASTPAARALLAQAPETMKPAWDAALGAAGAQPPVPVRSPDEAARKLDQNERVRVAAGVHGTPAFVWRTAAGAAGRNDGTLNPADVPALIASISGEAP